MPSQSFDAFFKAIRSGQIPGAIYLHGGEDVLKEDAIGIIIGKVIDPSLKDFNLDQRAAATLDPEAAETLCNTLPMMADRRVVVISGVEAWNKRARAKAAILRYLERPAPETVLILVQGGGESSVDKELAAGAVTVAVDPLPPDRATRWLEHHAQTIGLSLEPAAAQHMVKATGGSLGELRTELEKLAGLGDGVLTVAQVAALMGVRHGETPVDWVSAVLEGQTATALTILPHVLALPKVSAVQLVMLLGSSVIGLGIARGHFDRGVRGRALEGKIFQALQSSRLFGFSYRTTSAEWARLAPGWTAARVTRALAQLRRADERLKNTALADDRAILFDLVVELHPQWQHAA